MTQADDEILPVQPPRRSALVRGLRPRLWAKRALPPAPAGPGRAAPEPPLESDPNPAPEAPLTYDDQAHLHGGPGTGPRLDLED